jgi:glycosyltransferase involved in cell wall biosynthesis
MNMPRSRSLTRRAWLPPGRLSIIIPAFNEARFITPLLRKTLDVDLSAFGLSKEIIVIDDGSTDGTGRLAREVPGVTVYELGGNSGKGGRARQELNLGPSA